MKELKQVLTVPGNGVYTVHTARDRKESLYQKAFGTIDESEINKYWSKTIDGLDQSNLPALFGICSDCGGGILRGANWGPLFIREKLYSNIDTRLFEDIGDVRVIPHLLHDKYLNSETIESCREALYTDKDSNLPVSPLSIAEYAVSEIYKKNPNKKIISLGGDHSVSYPLVAAWANKMKNQGERAALIHFDAHTDLLDKRLGIDICFGSWTYHVLDLLSDSTDLYQLGIRSSGKDRDHWEKKFNFSQYWAQEIKQKGAAQIAQEIVDDLNKKNIKKIYISFDIDALDSKYASATGTPEPNGLEPHESMSIIQILLNNFELSGGDVVEVAPFISYPGDDQLSQSTTVELAADIVKVFLESAKK